MLGYLCESGIISFRVDSYAYNILKTSFEMHNLPLIAILKPVSNCTEEEGFDLGGGPGSDLEIPSSNDTRYLILKPTILNLDSKSSR